LFHVLNLGIAKFSSATENKECLLCEFVFLQRINRREEGVTTGQVIGRDAIVRGQGDEPLETVLCRLIILRLEEREALVAKFVKFVG